MEPRDGKVSDAQKTEEGILFRGVEYGQKEKPNFLKEVKYT